MSVGSEVGVMEGVGVTVAVEVGGSGEAVCVAVAVGVGASKIVPLHPARSAANKTIIVRR
jgi:CBS-domain-containing membrane protein